jgi:hypothetical protein
VTTGRADDSPADARRIKCVTGSGTAAALAVAMAIPRIDALQLLPLRARVSKPYPGRSSLPTSSLRRPTCTRIHAVTGSYRSGALQTHALPTCQQVSDLLACMPLSDWIRKWLQTAIARLRRQAPLPHFAGFDLGTADRGARGM